MSDRAKQLLLELLLIREKYSDQELRAVHDAVANGRFSAEVDLLMETLELLARHRRPAKKPPVNRMEPQEEKALFLSGLKGRRSLAVEKRLTSVAKRLGISGSVRSGDRNLLLEIENRLNEMTEEELGKFLKPYRLRSPVDEGYVGLSNYLMHNQ